MSLRALARRYSRRCPVVVLAAVLAAACAGSKATATRASIARDRATAQSAATALLRPFGLRIQRWSIDRRAFAGNTYELSVYAQPSRTQSIATYAARFAPLTAAVVPALLRRYPDLAWIDLCQERAGKATGGGEPIPVTRVEISRRGAAAVDWRHADVATLLARNHADSADVDIEVHFGIADTTTWRRAIAQLRSG